MKYVGVKMPLQLPSSEVLPASVPIDYLLLLSSLCCTFWLVLHPGVSPRRTKWLSGVPFRTSPHRGSKKERHLFQLRKVKTLGLSPHQLYNTVLNSMCTCPLGKYFDFLESLKDLRRRKLFENCIFPSSYCLLFHNTFHVSTRKIKTDWWIIFFDSSVFRQKCLTSPGRV